MFYFIIVVRRRTIIIKKSLRIKAFLYLWFVLGPFAVDSLKVVEGGAVVVDEAALWLQVTLNSFLSVVLDLILPKDDTSNGNWRDVTMT